MPDWIEFHQSRVTGYLPSLARFDINNNFVILMVTFSCTQAFFLQSRTLPLDARSKSQKNYFFLRSHDLILDHLSRTLHIIRRQRDAAHTYHEIKFRVQPFFNESFNWKCKFLFTISMKINKEACILWTYLFLPV